MCCPDKISVLSYEWCVCRERVHQRGAMGLSASIGGLRTASISETGGNPAWASRSDASIIRSLNGPHQSRRYSERKLSL